jgi:uncharacterized membrane protein YvlD (DUF360 family)
MAWCLAVTIAVTIEINGHSKIIIVGFPVTVYLIGLRVTVVEVITITLITVVVQSGTPSDGIAITICFAKISAIE